MKIIKRVCKLSRLSVLFFALLMPALSAAQPPGLVLVTPGWMSGGIDAINPETREISVSQKKYRVALKAQFTDMQDRKLSFDDMDLSYAIEFKLDESTGDIINIKVVVYP